MLFKSSSAKAKGCTVRITWGEDGNPVVTIVG